MKKRLLPLALLLALAAFFSPVTKESHAGICAYDQECVFGCQKYCGGFAQPCFNNCINPGCCIN